MAVEFLDRGGFGKRYFKAYPIGFAGVPSLSNVQDISPAIGARTGAGKELVEFCPEDEESRSIVTPPS